MADLQFGSIFAQALQNSMAEKAAERKWNQQLDFQNAQLKQQKELADKQYAFEQNKFDTEQKNWKFANEFIPDATDPLVTQYGLAQAGKVYNPTERQEMFKQKELYDQYLTDIGRNYKYYGNIDEAKADIGKQISDPKLLEQALSKLRGEDRFLSPQEKYALKMFRPQGSDKGVYDIEGMQYFLPTAEYTPLLDKQFQATEGDKNRATQIATASISAGPGYYATNYQKEKDAKNPVAIKYKTLDGVERVWFGTQADYDSGNWINKILGNKKDQTAVLEDGRKVKYGEWFKEKNKDSYVFASGPEMVSKARGDSDTLAKIDYVKKNYNISADSIKGASDWDDGANLSAIKKVQEKLSNVNSYLVGSNLSFYDINTNQAVAINNKIDAQLRKLYKRVESAYIFKSAPSYHTYEWLLELNDENYKIAKDLLNTQSMIFGKAVAPDTNNPQQVVDYFKRRTMGGL